MEREGPVKAGASAKKTVIIKKVKKRGHEGGHGGSWKVAYADFVTALMAFFLLLWLLTAVSPEKRARLSSYFKDFSLFEKGGLSFVMQFPTNLATGVKVIDDGDLDTQKGQELFKQTTQEGLGSHQMEVKRRADKLRKEVEALLPGMKDQVLVDTFEGGVRIEMIDKTGSPMFALGSREMTENGKKVLGVVAGKIKETTSKFAIEGHTDSTNSSSLRFINWDLSTERASAARRELERNGVEPDHLLRIAGYAETKPLIKEDPSDPRNRRISIMLFDETTNAGSPPANSSSADSSPDDSSPEEVQDTPKQPRRERPRADGKNMDFIDLYLFNR